MRRCSIGALTGKAVIARAGRQRRPRNDVAAALTSLAAGVAVAAVAASGSGQTTVSVSTPPPPSASAPVITTTKTVSIRLPPAAAPAGTVATAHIAPTQPSAFLDADSYFLVEAWKGQRWDPLYEAYLQRGATPTDQRYDPNLNQTTVGITSGTYKALSPSVASGYLCAGAKRTTCRATPGSAACGLPLMTAGGRTTPL